MNARPGTGRPMVSDVDWDAWEPRVRATLLFVIRDREVLLIHKKRGLGEGLLNGPGGKIDPGESPLECAVRETFEELRISATDVVPAGELSFQFLDGMSILCHVFRAAGFQGQPTETDEATPHWFAFDDVPFERMWPDDRLWFPHLVAGRLFTGRCTFDGTRLLDAVIDAG